MRLSFITLLASLFALIAATSPLHLRKRSPTISSRQYVSPRNLVDICVNLDVDSFTDLGFLLTRIKIPLCLCLKDLDLYLATNSEIQSLVRLLGPDVVGSRIRAIIDTSPQARTCRFPQHAHHTCNNEDPCHWACNKNYTRDGDKCVCAPPFISCNGVCDFFPKGCSSAVPRSLKARAQSILALRPCTSHEIICGRDNASAFGCVDTTSTLNSCGGCVSRHPRERNSDSGEDCTMIPHARIVNCSNSRCFVASCQDGWISNGDNTGCVRSHAHISGRVQRRSDPLSINVTSTTVVDSKIQTKMAAIVDAVLHLSLPSSADVTTTTSHAISLLNDVNTATANLVTSGTVRVFLRNIEHLLDVSTAFGSWLSSCGCVNRLGLSHLVEQINSLVDAATLLRTFCLGSVPESHTTLHPSGTDLYDRPLTISISDLAADLRLNEKAPVVHGPQQTNDLLTVLNVTSSDNHPTTLSADSDLLSNLTAIAHLVIKLQNNLATISSKTNPTGVDLKLASICRETKNLLNSTTVSGVMASLDNLVKLSKASLRLIEDCSCIDSLDLQPLHNDLKQILSVALDACTHGSNIPPSIKGDVPIVIGLTDLLNSLSLSFGSTREFVTVDGLGAPLSNSVNGLLNAVGIGPQNAKRDTPSELDGVMNEPHDLRWRGKRSRLIARRD